MASCWGRALDNLQSISAFLVEGASMLSKGILVVQEAHDCVQHCRHVLLDHARQKLMPLVALQSRNENYDNLGVTDPYPRMVPSELRDAVL